MTGRRIRFLATAADPPASLPGDRLVVLDTTWTPPAGERADLVPLRPVVSRVLGRVDPFRESLARLDAWAAAAGVPEAMTVDGVSWWYHLRPRLADSLNALLLWRLFLAELMADGEADAADHAAAAAEAADEGPAPGPAVAAPGADGVRAHPLTLQEPAEVDADLEADERRIREHSLTIKAPSNERALLVAAQAIAASDPAGRIEVVDEPAADVTTPAAPAPAAASLAGRLLHGWRADRRRSELDRRRALLEDRITRLAAQPGRVLVIAQPRIYQALATASGTRLADPQLAPTLDRFADHGLAPIVIGLELDHRDDEQWQLVRDDPSLLPQSLLELRWSDPGDRAAAPSGVPARLAARPAVRLEVEGADLGPAVMTELAGLAGSWLDSQRRQARRAARLVAELRPAAMFLNHEGIRTPWLAAARGGDVPVFAVQHGLIYPYHSVYRHPRDPALLLPTCTFTFGPYERDVLIEHGAYRPDEVAVAGSPRLDIDAAPQDRVAAERDREAVRKELGVAPGSRMLVVSTAHTVPFRRFLLPNLIDRLLGGPLPGVHVVFKQHPGELDEGPYRAVLAGIAAARAFAEPPMSVVRQVDLNRLLRAADAHLGLHSTVLTDAVVVGTPNLIAMTQAFSDLLGYVAAGVARPVATVDDVRRAMDDPPRSEPAARAAFLAAHFAPGPAADRIAAAIAAAIAARASSI